MTIKNAGWSLTFIPSQTLQLWSCWFEEYWNDYSTDIMKCISSDDTIYSIIYCTCVEVPVSAPLVSPRAILQARDPELRPPSSPGFGFLGEINSTSSTSSLSVSSFFRSGLRDCCLFSIRADGRWFTSESPQKLVLHAGLKGLRLTEALSPLMVCSSQASWTLVLLDKTSGCLQEYLQVTSTTCITHILKNMNCLLVLEEN